MVKPGYKQTEVGVIPEDWRVVKICEAMNLINGRAFKPSEWSSVGVPIIRIQNLNNALSDFNYYSGSVDDRNRVSRGDLLFAWSGTLGSSFGARVWDGVDGVLNQHIFKVVPNCSVLSKDYSFVVFKRIEEDIAKKAHGFKSSFVHIKKSDLDATLLPVPSIAEQRAIATALSDVDSLLAKLDALIAKKRDIKQAAMQQLLTGRQRLPGFSGAWEVKRLGDLGAIYGGLTGKTKVDFGEGTSRYITFMNVMSNVVIDCDIFDRVNVLSAETQNRVKKGDLFFNGSSETPEEVAMCAVLLEEVQDVYLNSFCFGFRFREAVQANGIFFAYYLRSDEGRELMKSLAQGSTRYNLSKRALLNSSLLVPALPEQTAIATVLSDMDAELATLEARRDKTRALKQGMMQQLLTGRIRLL